MYYTNIGCISVLTYKIKQYSSNIFNRNKIAHRITELLIKSKHII